MQEIKLYDYQKNAILACQKDLSHSQLISMPTGTGKTITFLCLAKHLNKKTLIIVHREELLKQTYEKAKLCGFKENEIFLVNSEKKETFGLLNIAMVQSLNRNLEKYSASDIEVIIIDEAHHATAPSYINIFKHFKIFEEKKPIFGFTATPLRGDKEHLANIFLSHSFKMTLSEATRLGYIVPVHGIRVEIEKSLKEIDSQQGDYDISQLDKVMNCESLNNLVVERCKNLKKTPSIVFCTSVDHAEKIALKLRNEKRKAISISYKTPKKTLDRIFNLLHQGRIEFITNAVKLSEGFDHPPIQSIILARPTRSPVLYKQMIGRGLRNFENKHDCFVLEFTSNDPKMMKWEDIDETCTYQSTSLIQRKTEEEARNKYKSLFGSPDIEILDVRVSPFDFYECKIRRFLKYKKLYFLMPFDEGFCFFEMKPTRNKTAGFGGNYYHIYGTTLFWKNKFESFYAWEEPDICFNENTPDTPDRLFKFGIQRYTQVNKMGRWYPSELEPLTRSQKKNLEKLGIGWNSIKSARKAEFELENKCLKIAVDKFLSLGKYSGTMSII